MHHLLGVAPAPSAAPAPSSTASAPSTPPRKRRKSASDVVKVLTDALALKDAGVLSSPQLAKLKDRFLEDD